MTEQSKLPCPDVDGCGSSDAYSWNDAKKTGYCHSCELKTWEFKGKLYGKHEGSSAKAQVFSEEEPVVVDDMYLPEEVDVVESTSEGSYQPCRGITAKSMEHFGVKTYTNKNRHEYIYPSGGIKTRYLDEKGFSAKGLKADEFFGQNLFPANCSKMVTLVEGELDAISAWQMLTQGSSYVTPVVSFPSATPSAKFWEGTRKWLDSFEKIVLSVDTDKPGEKLADKVAQMFPGKVYKMDHGMFKDANEFLQAGKGKDYKAAWWAAKKVKPDNILSSSEDYLTLFEESPDFEYFKTGIPQLDAKMLGICKGYLTLIQAPSGLGKSEFMRYLEYQLLTNSEYSVASCRKEESKIRSLLGLVSYDLQENVTLKSLVEEKELEEEVRESIKRLTRDERFNTFSIDETQSNEETINQLRYMIAALEVDYIFIEPIQDIVVGSNASDKEGRLSDLITQMGNICGETGVGIVIIAHENGTGGAMYSSMITKKAGFKITLSGDRESDDPTEKNRTYLKVQEKNRVGMGFGDAGAVDFDLDSYTLNVVQGPQEPVIHKDDDDEMPF